MAMNNVPIVDDPDGCEGIPLASNEHWEWTFGRQHTNDFTLICANSAQNMIDHGSFIKYNESCNWKQVRITCCCERNGPPCAPIVWIKPNYQCPSYSIAQSSHMGSRVDEYTKHTHTEESCPDIPFPAKVPGYSYTSSVKSFPNGGYEDYNVLVEFCSNHSGTIEYARYDCKDQYRCKYQVDNGDYCTCHPKEYHDHSITLREFDYSYTDSTELTITPGCDGVKVFIPTTYDYLTFGPILRMPHLFDVDFPKGSVMVSIGNKWFAWRMLEFKKKILEDYQFMDQADKDEVIKTGMINTSLAFILGLYKVETNIICEDGTVEYIIFPEQGPISEIYIEVSKNAPEMTLKDAFIWTTTVSNCALPKLYIPDCHDCSDESGECDSCMPCYEFSKIINDGCNKYVHITIENTNFDKCEFEGYDNLHISYTGTSLLDQSNTYATPGFEGPSTVLFDLSKPSVTFKVEIMRVTGKLMFALTPEKNNECGSDDGWITIECDYDNMKHLCCNYMSKDFVEWKDGVGLKALVPPYMRERK